MPYFDLLTLYNFNYGDLGKAVAAAFGLFFVWVTTIHFELMQNWRTANYISTTLIGNTAT